MKDFLKLLILISEKAANIARIIRSDEDLFSFLVEEKQAEEKNLRFLHDFKTLADILIQESARWTISMQYPEMRNNIFGEESNTFANSVGNTITVEVKESEADTAELLSSVMGTQSCDSARKLAKEVHRKMDSSFMELDPAIPENGIITDYSNVGIWIDPIDATNEYIKSSSFQDVNISQESIEAGGLPCVTILIGAFHLNSGEPIVGIINQPFFTSIVESSSPSDGPKWKGRCLWGISRPPHYSNCCIPSYNIKSRPLLIMSASEDSALKAKLEEYFMLVVAPGAGYKLLAVIAGLVDCYILSKDTTHFWDTCGPHAILKGLGGGIIAFNQFLAADRIEDMTDISYSENNITARNAHYANLGGIIAYRDVKILALLQKCFK